MATFADTPVPRKRMTTYGKAARKRISDYGFVSPVPKAEAPETGESAFLKSRSPSVPRLESDKPDNIPRRYTSRTPSSASPVNANVFDVPSSEDETAPPTPRPVPKKPARKVKGANTKKVLSTAAEDGESRKKVKLSPVRPSPQKPPPVEMTSRKPMSNATNQVSKQVNKPLGAGQGSTMVARPKPSTYQRKLERPSTPQKVPPAPKLMTPTTPSRGLSDPSTMDVDRPASYISPRGLQMWKDLLDPLDNSEVDSTMLDIETRDDRIKASPSGMPLSTRTLSKPAGISKHSRKSPEKLPRQRLIDSLVEQTVQQDEMSDDMLSSDESDIASSLPLSSLPPNGMDFSGIQSLSQDTPGPAAIPSSQGSQSAGPKFTYSRQRSMLQEKDIMQELALDIPSQPTQAPNSGRTGRGSRPTLPPLQNFPEEEDDIQGTPGIRSVHELRQAGANNRFLDEIEDLLDRIGTPSTPSSMRRGGLLDLASKIKDKDFERKFRANSVELRLFVHLGQETDFIAGFAMVSILIALLADTSMPHVVAQLRRHGITRLLIRLLECQTGIVPLSKERKSNMSKITRSSISKLQDFLLKLPVWEALQPEAITPRTTALKCLELMIRQTREAGNSGDIISKELSTALFSILKSAEEESLWDLPNGQQAIDFHLALSALESHSVTARTAYDESIWISDYLPIIADTLQIALSRPVEGFGLLQVLILRLTLNVTNNNPKASDVFAREALMAVMGQVIVAKFKMISRFLTEEEFSITIDHLILVLGVMINFAEWSSLARENLEGLEGKSNDPLGDMTQLFMDHQASTSEVRAPFSLFAQN
jgi:hypothetical protein